MLSKLCGHISNNVYFVSRQKMMQKRRKITSKKQKVAKKKFLEHNPEGSYTNELRILQIQKELDKKVSKNYHLNELMDELFYPDVRYANQKIMEQNLLNISANPQQNLQKQKTQEGSSNINDEQDQEFNELAQQIYLCQIPTQLFELYLKNSQFFTQHHLVILLQKLQFYFQNKQIIQERVTEKWKHSLEKLKLTDAQKKKRKRCPYIFIEQDELIREEDWNKVIKDINKKILLSTEHISSQVTERNDQSQELEQLEESYYSLQNNCDLALQIKRVANYLPEEIFDSIVKKMFAILNLKSVEEQSSERLPIFSHSQKVKLLTVLSLKSVTKSTLTKSLHIESPEASEREEAKIISIGKLICKDILKSQECSADDLGVVLMSQEGQYKFLDSSLLELAQHKMLRFLSKTSLERSIEYMTIFWNDGSMKDSNFIEVLMFDIYRKLPFSASKNHLFRLLSIIENSVITFKESKMSIKTSSIYPRIAESTAKYLNKNALTHEEVKSFMNSVYNNFPLYKVENRARILEMITTSVVKMGEGFKLEQLTELFFKTTILGHRSKIFSKYVFERYQKEFKNLMKQYKSEKVQLISDKNQKSQNSQEIEPNLPSIKEMVLEENLLMMFWCYVVNLNSQKAQLPLSDMIEMFPHYIYSQDPMTQDLKEDLNLYLQDYNFFPLIKNKSIEVKSKKDNQKIDVKNTSLLIKTNTNERYRHAYHELTAKELTQKLEQGNQPLSSAVFDDLVFYLMRYSLVNEFKSTKSKIPERWNETVRNIFNHRGQQFDKIQIEFMKLYEKFEDKSSLVISSRLISILEKRKKQKFGYKSSGGKIFETKKSYKLYQLL